MNFHFVWKPVNLQHSSQKFSLVEASLNAAEAAAAAARLITARMPPPPPSSTPSWTRPRRLSPPPANDNPQLIFFGMILQGHYALEGQERR